METTETLLVVEVRTLYKTTYYGDGRISWHEPYQEKATLKSMRSTVGSLELQTAVLEIGGESYPVSHLRSGLDATVVTIHVRGEHGWECALYTSLLTEAGEKRGGPGTPTRRSVWNRY